MTAISALDRGGHRYCYYPALRGYYPAPRGYYPVLRGYYPAERGFPRTWRDGISPPVPRPVFCAGLLRRH